MLPDSLYFGRVEPDSASSVLSALDDGRIDLSRFRGRTSFSLAEQAVEHFVRRELGIDAVDGVVIESQAADGSFLVQLARPPRARPRATPDGVGRRTAHLQGTRRPAGPDVHLVSIT